MLDVIVEALFSMCFHSFKKYLSKKNLEKQQFVWWIQQFAWWIYQRFGKGNRRVLPSSVSCKIKHFPKANGKYVVLHNEGEKDGEK